MPNTYIYVVDRDFGFAPNPFHGLCTLATCKPQIRKSATIGDWVVGMGGSRLNAKGRCVFAMRVTDSITFNEYWEDPSYADKKPVRNGSSKMMLGDNIYQYDETKQEWHQLDSHHSHPDGSRNLTNLQRDTKTDAVLISDHFYYFGRNAPEIPESILLGLGYSNGIGHRKFALQQCSELLKSIESAIPDALNKVIADPFDFNNCDQRYTGTDSRVI